MTQDLIRYDILAQDALRSVIRKVLSEVVKTGLPGNHHFFITFASNAPGVRISNRLREKYPEQMTIVIQHQYWDMAVNEQNFEIGLSFGDVLEKLTVPFAAIRGFYDPSVNFELEFDTDIREEPEGDKKSADVPALVTEATKPKTNPKSGKTKSAAKDAAKDSKPADTEKSATDADAENSDEAGQSPSADVVSLDAFRKKAD